MTSCQQCGATTAGSNYCHNCTTAFTNNLRSLAVGLPELRLIAARKASVTARQHGGGNRSVAPIPLNMSAYQLQSDIIRFAGMLGTALTLRYNRHMPAESILTAASRRAPALMQRRDAASIIGITRRYEHKLVMQLTPPEDKRLIGTCPSCERDLWCTDSEIAGQWIVCKCGQALKVRDVQEQHLLMCALADGQNAKGTASAVSKLLLANGIKVRRQTIAQWKNRGIIRPCGSDAGKPVFKVWDIWRAITR
nr:MAG TPA: Putative acetylornithine deacetylase [Caudoviricetes sp.]